MKTKLVGLFIFVGSLILVLSPLPGLARVGADNHNLEIDDPPVSFRVRTNTYSIEYYGPQKPLQLVPGILRELEKFPEAFQFGSSETSPERARGGRESELPRVDLRIDTNRGASLEYEGPADSLKELPEFLAELRESSEGD